MQIDVERHPCGPHPRGGDGGVPDTDLDHRAASEGTLHRTHLPVAVALADHHLRAIGMLQAGKFLCRTGEGRGKAQDIGPEGQ